MPIQIGLLAKAAIAQMAFEGSLFIVNVTDVPLQITRDAERTLAIFALVRLFAGVRAHVTRQICRSRKHFATIFACVAIL